MMEAKEDFSSNEMKLVSLQQLLSSINPVEAAKALLANSLVAGSIRQAVLAMKDEDFVSVYQCTRCAYGSHSYAEWAYHSRAHDNDEWCGLCDYKAASQEELSDHQRYHTDTLKYKCTLCPYLTCTQLSLSDHIHLVHRTVYTQTCDTCGYRTNGGSSVLNMHKSMHSFMNHKLPYLFSSPQANGSTRDGGLDDLVVLKVEPVEMEISGRSLASDSQLLETTTNTGKAAGAVERKRSNRKPWWDTQTEIAPSVPAADGDHLHPQKDASPCTFCGQYYDSSASEHQCRVVRPTLTASTLYCSACSFETTDRKLLTEHYVTLHSRCWKSLVIKVSFDYPNLDSMCSSVESFIPNRLKHLADNLLVMRMDGGSVAACVSSPTVCLFRCTKCFNTFTSLDLQAGHKLLDQCLPLSRSYQFGCSDCRMELSSAEEGLSHHLDCHTTLKSVKTDSKVVHSAGSNVAEDALLMVEALQKVGVERSAENMPAMVEVEMMPGMYEMSCHLCSYVSDESDKYNDHLFSKHWGFPSDSSQDTHKVNMATVYGCNLCSYICEQTNTLSLHMATHAAPRRTLNKKKSSKASVKAVSMATGSTSDIPPVNSNSPTSPDGFSSSVLQCTTCGFQTDSKPSLRLHSLQHKEDKPRYKCEQCSFTTSHSSTLTIHMRSHTGYKPFVCSMCGKGFTSNSELRKHERRHAGLVEKKFLCDICNKSYSTPQHLKVHQRKHTGDRPFKCEYCSFAATSKCVLTNHRTTHTGEKNYKCHLCPFSCASSGTLSNHRRLKHNIVNKRKTLAETTPESIILAARVAGKSKGFKAGSSSGGVSAAVSAASSGQAEQSTAMAAPLTSDSQLPTTMNTTEQVYEIIQTGSCDFQMVSDTTLAQ